MRVANTAHRVLKAHDSDDEEEDFGGLLCHGEVTHAAPPPALYGGSSSQAQGGPHPRLAAYVDGGGKVQRSTPKAADTSPCAHSRLLTWIR
jgi:hypothetical protein